MYRNYIREQSKQAIGDSRSRCFLFFLRDSRARTLRGYAELCGAMRSYAELCGAMRSYAELCGAMRSYAELCGAMWAWLDRMWSCDIGGYIDVLR